MTQWKQCIQLVTQRFSSANLTVSAQRRIWPGLLSSGEVTGKLNQRITKTNAQDANTKPAAKTLLPELLLPMIVSADFFFEGMLGVIADFFPCNSWADWDLRFC